MPHVNAARDTAPSAIHSADERSTAWGNWYAHGA